MTKLESLSAYESSTKQGVVVVDFSAPWCPDCVRIMPVMKELEKDYHGKVEFFEVNIDQQEELKESNGIRRIPTLVFYKDGKEVGQRLVEPGTRKEIETALKDILE